jgi:hypothetical protein
LLPKDASLGSFTITTLPVTVDTPVNLTARTPALLVAEAQKATLTVTVKKPAVKDVTNLVAVIPGGFHFNHTTQLYVQEVMIVNQLLSQTEIPAPIYVVLNACAFGAPPCVPPTCSAPPCPAPSWTLAGWALFGNTTVFPVRSTVNVPPAGRPYIAINQGLNPGDTVTLELEFSNPENQPIVWNAQILAGPGTP